MLKSTVYFQNTSQQISSAYSKIGGLLLTGNGESVYNTFLAQSNFLRLFNNSASTVNVTVEVYDLAGVMAGSSVVEVPANSGQDVELNATLGFGLPIDTFGIVSVTPDIGNAVNVQNVRVKPTTDFSAIDNW